MFRESPTFSRNFEQRAVRAQNLTCSIFTDSRKTCFLLLGLVCSFLNSKGFWRLHVSRVTCHFFGTRTTRRQRTSLDSLRPRCPLAPCMLCGATERRFPSDAQQVMGLSVLSLINCLPPCPAVLHVMTLLHDGGGSGSRTTAYTVLASFFAPRGSVSPAAFPCSRVRCPCGGGSGPWTATGTAADRGGCAVKGWPPVPPPAAAHAGCG